MCQMYATGTIVVSPALPQDLLDQAAVRDLLESISDVLFLADDRATVEVASEESTVCEDGVQQALQLLVEGVGAGFTFTGGFRLTGGPSGDGLMQVRVDESGQACIEEPFIMFPGEGITIASEMLAQWAGVPVDGLIGKLTEAIPGSAIPDVIRSLVAEITTGS